MSLVAYDSSDDSERDDPSPEPRSSAKPGGLFTSLPAPKRSEPAVENQKPGPELLRAKKRSEPVRINVPEIRADSVSYTHTHAIINEFFFPALVLESSSAVTPGTCTLSS